MFQEILRKGNVLTRVCVSVHGGGGGYPRQVPIPDGGGYPHPVPMKGGGYPILLVGRGTPIPDLGWGVPPIQVRSQVRTGGGGWHPQLEQHSMYLLHGGRYASCIHAGGLSCLYLNLSIHLASLIYIWLVNKLII